MMNTNDVLVLLGIINRSQNSAVVFDNLGMTITFFCDEENQDIAFNKSNYKKWVNYIRKNYRYGKFNETQVRGAIIVGTTKMVEKVKDIYENLQAPIMITPEGVFTGMRAEKMFIKDCMGGSGTIMSAADAMRAGLMPNFLNRK